MFMVGQFRPKRQTLSGFSFLSLGQKFYLCKIKHCLFTFGYMVITCLKKEYTLILV